MIKRTIYIGNPSYLKTKTEQLVIRMTESEQERVVPIEDIGILILDHYQITITQGAMTKLLENNTAVITCDATHHPVGLLLPLDVHTLQAQRFQYQIEASLPLKKQLWQQTIMAKIYNQSQVLKRVGHKSTLLSNLVKQVKSGDSDNHEAQAASYYWKHLFGIENKFKREREGRSPNHILNYGYAIVRALVARSLVGSGMLPTLGIFHRNQYNAYCLADDIMEPFRPYVDMIVWELIQERGMEIEMDTEVKKRLLGIPAMDVVIQGEKSPMMVGVKRTTASLAKCFEGKSRKLVYPELQLNV